MTPIVFKTLIMSAVIESWTSERFEYWRLWFLCVIDYAACFWCCKHGFETGSQARTGIRHWLAYYNAELPHSTHGIFTPDEAYESKTQPMRMAAWHETLIHLNWLQSGRRTRTTSYCFPQASKMSPMIQKTASTGCRLYSRLIKLDPGFHFYFGTQFTQARPNIVRSSPWHLFKTWRPSVC